MMFISVAGSLTPGQESNGLAYFLKESGIGSNLL